MVGWFGWLLIPGFLLVWWVNNDDVHVEVKMFGGVREGVRLFLILSLLDCFNTHRSCVWVFVVRKED